MPQLQNLQSGVRFTPFTSTPSKLGTDPGFTPQELVSTAPLARAQAQSALMGTVAKTLSDLPSQIASNYLQGEQIGVTTAKNDLLKQVYSGGTLTPAQQGT